MKTNRFLLAAAVMLGVTACAGNPTGPDSALRPPVDAQQNGGSTTTTTTTTPAVEDNDGGTLGSGVGS